MYILQEDIEAGVDPLPIRKGCPNITNEHSGCCCLGVCREIVTTIPRNIHKIIESHAEQMKRGVIKASLAEYVERNG